MATSSISLEKPRCADDSYDKVFTWLILKLNERGMGLKYVVITQTKLVGCSVVSIALHYLYDEA